MSEWLPFRAFKTGVCFMLQRLILKRSRGRMARGWKRFSSCLIFGLAFRPIKTALIPCMARFSGIRQNLFQGFVERGRWAGVFLIFAFVFCTVVRAQDDAGPRRPDYIFSDSEAFFVDELERRALLYFEEQTDPITGLTRDRAPTVGGPSHAPASIAATGFALTVWCIADNRHWMASGEARRRVIKTLRFILTRVPHERGWIYHFIDA